MIAFIFLIIIGVILLWFLLSPLFGKIGNFLMNINQKMKTDEIKNKNQEEKSER